MQSLTVRHEVLIVSDVIDVCDIDLGVEVLVGGNLLDEQVDVSTADILTVIELKALNL